MGACTLEASQRPYREDEPLLETILETSVKSVGELTNREYRQCYQLNLGHVGMMRPALVASRKHFPHEEVFRIVKDEILLSWAIVYNDNVDIPGRMLAGDDPVYTAHFYTRVSHRRLGLAERIRREVDLRYSEYTVLPWDARSHDFYESTKGRSRVSYS